MENSSHGDRILTRHPEGKKGKRIPVSRYTTMRDTLLGIFAIHHEIYYKELSLLTSEQLSGVLDGSIPWLMETVMLDLLAGGVIEKLPGSPLRLKLCRC